MPSGSSAEDCNVLAVGAQCHYGSKVAASTCIYCGSVLGPETRAAHVIPSALGGRKKSKEFCCTSCNNAISKVERSLCEVLKPLTAHVGVRGDRGRAPSARVVDAAQGRVEVWGTKAQSVPRPPTVIAAAENFAVITGGAPDLAGMAQQLAHFLRRAGKTPSDLQTGDVKLKAGKHVGFLGESEFKVELGHVDHQRTIVKMMVELVAVHSPELANRPELQRARDFVVRGSPVLEVLPDPVTVGLIHVPEPPAHLCEVWTAKSQLIGRVVLFGRCPFTAPLSALWGSHPFCAAYQVDPVDGRELFDNAGRADGPLPSGWPCRAWDEGAHDAYRQRFKTAMQARIDRQLKLHVEGEVRRRWEEGLKGCAPTAEDEAHLRQLLDAERQRHRRRQDEFTPLDEAVVVEMVRKEFERLAAEDGQ